MSSAVYLIESALDACSPTERKLGEYIVKNPKLAMDCGVTELAARAGVSSAAIVRLCKRLQIGGFNELKLMLAKDVFSSTESKALPDFKFHEGTGVEEITRSVIQSARYSLDNVEKLINEKLLSSVVSRILEARSIHLAGIGASGIAAMDFHQKLTRLGLLSINDSDSHMIITAAATLTDRDLLIAFSYSGETREIVDAAEVAKAAGAYVVAVARVGANTLSKVADCVISIPDTESLTRHGATISRLNQLIIVDILYAALITRAMDRSMANIAKTREAIEFCQMGKRGEP